MRVGDLIEWIAATAFTAAAYLATHLAWPSLIVAGVCLAYFAQCWASHPIKLTVLTRNKGKSSKVGG